MDINIEVPAVKTQEYGLPDKIKLSQLAGRDTVFITMERSGGMTFKVQDLLDALSKLNRKPDQAK